MMEDKRMNGAYQRAVSDFVGREAALVRILGMTVAIIGWFYLFGGRSGGRQVVAASVLDRIILVPLVLVPIAISGVFPHLLRMNRVAVAFSHLLPAVERWQASICILFHIQHWLL